MPMHPLEPAGEDLLRRARAHSVAEGQIPISAERLFALLEEERTWRHFFPVIRKVEWTSPRPFQVGTTRTVTVIGGIRLDEVFWAWKPGASMAFAVTAVSRPWIRGLSERYDFIPLDDARCRLRWEMGIELAGRASSAEARMVPSLGRTQQWCLGRLAKWAARERGPAA